MAREIGLTGAADAGASFDGVYTATGADTLLVPQDALILTGAYHRAGPDLMIEDGDGHKVLVVDYFRTETPPDLVTAGGARIAADLAERLAGSEAPGQVAQADTGQAAAPIGEVESVTGQVTATHPDGTQVQLAQGTPVYQGDVIETGKDAAVGIRFIDETVFAMDDAGRMVLDEMVYDPASKSGSAAFSLVQGVFSFATGQIAKTDPSSLVVRTPVAMIGVRGTDVAVDLHQLGEDSRIVCREGAIVVSNDGGEQLVLAGQQVLLATFQQAPAAPVPVSLGTIDFDFGRALQFRPQQHFEDLNQDRHGENEDDKRHHDGGDAFAGVDPNQLGQMAPAAGGQQGKTGTISLVAAAIEGGVDLGSQPTVDTESSPLGSSGTAGGGGDRFSGFYFVPEKDDAIRGGDGGDTLVGTDGPDEMYGGGGDDVLLSSPGNDSLYGGPGIDTADYSADSSGIVADLAAGTVSGQATGNDVVDGIENIVGTNFGDQVEGADGDNTLVGGGGDDTIGAAGGNDVVDGGAGNDSLIGGSGAGDDLYIGGEGRDQISYPSATAGITVNLQTGIVDGVAGGVGTDTLVSIEDVLASNFDDLVIGDDGANLLMGADGNDTLVGNGGDDTLDGGAGTDLVSFADSSAAVTVDLGAGTATGPDGNDQLIAIENVEGSAFADVLTGDGGANLLIGGDGVDTISGGAGDDTIQAGAEDAVDDVMDGGAGTDRLQASGPLRLAGFSAANAIEVIQAAGAIRGTGAANLFDFSAITLLGITMINALGGDDTVTGSAAADLIVGGEGNDVLVGGGGDDTLTGGGGDDNLAGGDGNDLLSGAPGADTLSGGAGNDTLLVGATDALDDMLDGGAGTDRLETGGDLQLAGFGPGNSIEQVAVGGQVQGTGDANLLDFSATTLTGATGIFGQGGDDTLIGSPGADLLAGGDGNDSLSGNAGDDTLLGQAGDDTLVGGAGDDSLSGGTGNDSLVGNSGNDVLIGNSGVDTISGGAGNDTLVAGATNAVDDVMDGGSGTDVLQSTGNLQLAGFGPGNSIEQVSIGGQLQGTGDANLLDFSATTLTGATGIDAQAGDDTVIGSTGADNLIGNTGDDSLSSNAGNDTLSGDAGNDTLAGDAGNDLLTGGDGVDSVSGGAGNDTLVAGATDAVNDVFDGGSGTDVLQASGNLQLAGFGPGNSIEQVSIGGQLQGTGDANLLDFSAAALTGVTGIDAQAGDDTVIGSAGADNLIGNTGNDNLTGNAGNDTLSGGGGNDVLAGGAGIDTVSGGDGNDTLVAGATDAVNDVFDGGAGTDVLQASGNLQLSGFGPGNSIEQISINGELQGTSGANQFNLSTTSLAGVSAINLQGGSDSLVGSADGDSALGGDGNDTLLGQAGADTLAGGDGNDQLFGGTDADTLLGDAGNDTLDGGTGGDSLSGGDGTDSLLGGDGGDSLFGDGGGDSLFGQAGGDSLFGGDGNDQLTGGIGVDTLFGGAGNDTLFVSADEDSADSYFGGDGSDRLVAGNGLQLADFTSANSVEVIEANGQISGTGGGDTIDVSGTSLVNVTGIDGGTGDDALTGNGDDNLISGGDGADTLLGGTGNDVLFGDNAVGTATVSQGTAGTLGTLTAGNYAQFWGDVLLLSGATTSADGLSGFEQGLVAINPDGVGVEGVVGQPVVDQIAYDVTNGISEVLQVDFEREVSDVSVTVSHLIGPEQGVFEQGQWVALHNGVEVGSGLFSDVEGANNGQVSFDVNVDGPIDSLMFSATPYIDANGVFQFPVSNDSSDYFVRQIAFSYADTTYTDSGTGADLLVGGAGADTMRGGAAADLFRYDALGDGTQIAQNVTVSQSGQATDVILDFVSGQDGLSFDASSFDASASFATIGERYDGTNSGHDSGAVFVFDGKYLSYDADVQQDGYTAIAEVKGDAPVAGDIAVN